MRFFYNIFVRIYGLLITLAYPFNAKARLWLDGRKDIFKKLRAAGFQGQSIIWVHCASLGEFEQGRPVIEKLRECYTNHKILITFFSPSGYEVRKNYQGADYIFYLPLDTKKNVRNFLKIVRPQMAIFVKYEFWFNYIEELHKQKIPLFCISVMFRNSQYFFKPWGLWFRKQLLKVTWLFVQNEKSLELLDKIKIHHADVSGDTRFDRVLEIPNEPIDNNVFNTFTNNNVIFIGGSTWKPDEKLISSLLVKHPQNLNVIIAPHLVDKDHIADVLALFKDFDPVLFSEMKKYMGNEIPDKVKAELRNSKVLIIDSIGMLSHIYRFADIAYIGGGFGVGIHNVLEAATYGVPVVFGPNHKRFNEAVMLKDVGGGFAISDEKDFMSICGNLIDDNTYRQQSGKIAVNYVEQNAGATPLIINKAKEYIVAR